MNERALAAFQDEMEKIAEVEKVAIFGALRAGWKGLRRGRAAGLGWRAAAGRGLTGAQKQFHHTGGISGAFGRGAGWLKGMAGTAEDVAGSTKRLRSAAGDIIGVPGADAAAGAAAGAVKPGGSLFGQELFQGAGGQALPAMQGIQNWAQQATAGQMGRTALTGLGGLYGASMLHGAVTGGPTINRYG